jgi:hypothetical protein
MKIEFESDHEAFLQNPDWNVSRLTELLLMGHSWKQARDILMMSKPEFDRFLGRAVAKAQNEQKKVKARRYPGFFKS